METQRFEYFFDLPPEIREHILSYICLFPGGVLVGGGSDGVSIPAAADADADIAASHHTDEGDAEDEDEDGQGVISANPPVDLFLASPFFYREAGDLYYGRNVFHLDFGSAAMPGSSGWGRWRNLRRRRRQQQQQQQQQEEEEGGGGVAMARSGGGGGGVSAVMRLLTDTDAAGARRRIRSVACRMAKIGALAMDHVVPALADMALGGRLRRVRVDVLERSPGGGGQQIGGGRGLSAAARHAQWAARGGADLAGNPALRSLLVLLTDPDIEASELRVSRRFHRQFWCRFHGESACAVSRNGVVGHGEEEDGSHEGDYVDVDIRKLVQALGCGAEFSIKKIGSD